MALLIIIVFGGVALYQIPRLKRTGSKRELVFFSLFWLAGFVLMMLLNAGVRLPNTVELFMRLFNWIGLHY